jgi:hypothetical protein
MLPHGCGGAEPGAIRDLIDGEIRGLEELPGTSMRCFVSTGAPSLSPGLYRALFSETVHTGPDEPWSEPNSH